MSDLQKDFQKALEDVKQTNPNDETKLKLYGLYKQIHSGDNNTSKPWAYQLEKSYKWQAWKNNSGRSKDDCMMDYIILVNGLTQK